jgi:hypothetical protein
VNEPYTYVDRFDTGIGVVKLRHDAILLSIYPPQGDVKAHIEIPDDERRKLADAITDFYTKKIDRVLTTCREQRSGTGPGATVPVGAILAAIYISDRQPSAEDIKRAHEIQALIDAEGRAMEAS